MREKCEFYWGSPSIDSLPIHVLYIRIVLLYIISYRKNLVFHYVYTSLPLCWIIGKSLSLFGGYLAASFPVDLCIVFSFSVHIFLKMEQSQVVFLAVPSLASGLATLLFIRWYTSLIMCRRPWITRSTQLPFFVSCVRPSTHVIMVFSFGSSVELAFEATP